jgi:hypothetical protein
MPPRGGRGRGRGRWANRGTTRGGSRVAKTTPRSKTTRRSSFGNINGHYHDSYDGDGIRALFEPPGLLIIAGLLPEQFPDYDSEEQSNDESDEHSDYGSATTKTPRKKLQSGLHDADDAHTHAPNPGNDDDWTETDVEVFVTPKARGFFKPPPKREVIRKVVKKAESSRYNDAVPKVSRASLTENFGEDEPPSQRSSQKSNRANEDLPIIVEHGASDDEVDGDGDGEEEIGRHDAGPARGSRKASTAGPEKPRVEIIDEGELSDSKFPVPYLKRTKAPPEKHCEDKADWIMRKRFAPMSDPQDFIKALTKFDPSKRSTEVLFKIALNAQRALRAWQDEYLALDMKTAPASNPPKKPLTGGRNTVDELIFDDMLEADLYSYTYDPKKAPGQQDPFRQRAGGGKFVGGRELRQRRGRDVGAVDLSDPEITDTGGYGTRRRRAAQLQNNQLEVPLRGQKRVNSAGPSDYDGPPRKRGRPSAMQSRVRQLREESSAVSTSGEQDQPVRRRGRPPGSKNTQPRSDAGIKKGPRKPKVTSEPGESENASQYGIVDRADAVTPISHPSVDDHMAVHQAPATELNGIGTQNARPALNVPVNGEAIVLSTERASIETGTPVPNLDDLKDKDPKKRVRSEKRSKSMTEWWAARKAKAAEDRKQQLAQQAEADRIAEEQARAAHAAHQAQFPPQDARYWPQIASQHPQHPQHPQAYQNGPPAPPPNFVSGPPSQAPQQGPPQHIPGPPPSQHFHPQQLSGPPPSGASMSEPQNMPPPLPAGHPQGLPTQGPPPPPQMPPQHQFHHGPPPPMQGPPPQGHPQGPLPIMHQSQPPQRPSSAAFAGSPNQPPPQHVFHHHPAPPPPPPPAHTQFQPAGSPQAPTRQPSPLRRIINYVSDPSKAAQPTGPPYQTIMTPGASSPTIIQHNGHFARPESRGRTSPAPASGFMSAFHVNNHTGRPPIPGTGSFRPDTPGKSSFTAYTAPAPPRTQGRMTGAQVQDLALAAVQPMQRKSMEDVLKEQRDWKLRNLSPPPPSERSRPLFKLQPAPMISGAPPPQPLPPLVRPQGREPSLPPFRSPSQHERKNEQGPPALPNMQPLPHMPPHERPPSQGPPASGPNLGFAASLRASLANSPLTNPQLPPFIGLHMREKQEQRLKSESPFSPATSTNRQRSVSLTNYGPIRFKNMHEDGGGGGGSNGKS